MDAAEFDTELFAAYTLDWQDRVRVIGTYVRTYVCMSECMSILYVCSILNNFVVIIISKYCYCLRA